jgi:hypothetical protein
MNARPTPARGRIETFDGLRGLLLILMLNTHVPVSGGFKLFHPQALSLVDAASGFVFMSGLMSGLVYGPAIARHGLLAGAGKVWRRAATITLYVLSLAAGLAVAAQIIPGARSAWGEWLGPSHRQMRQPRSWWDSCCSGPTTRIYSNPMCCIWR